MDENKIKHLEFIQGVITRLARNSFAYKGWSITLVAAIFALAVKEATSTYLLIALIPTISFWGLDAYYLRQERLFRMHYDVIRKSSSADLEREPFSMDLSPYIGQASTWWQICWSKTIGWLYGTLTLTILLVSFIASLFPAKGGRLI